MLIWIGSIALAGIVCFGIGGVWYGAIFGSMAAELQPGGAAAGTATSGTAMAFELARCLIGAAAFAWFIHRLGLVTVPQGLMLAVIVWAGFQVVGLIGSVLHEGYPPLLYAIHMGDALAKAVASCLIITTLTARFA